MSTIAFYVTDSGFGHVTRTLAIIERLLDKSDCHIYYVCGKNQNDYARAYLSKYIDRITFNDLNTEVGTVLYEDTFKPDILATTQKIEEFLSINDAVVSDEIETVKEVKVSLIVSDISLLGILVGKRMGIQVVGITNYTWYHRYLKMGIDKVLVQRYLEIYNQLDMLYTYKYADDMKGITCPIESVGVVARKVNHNSVGDIKSKYWPSCFISVGQVGGHGGIDVDFQAGHILATGNVDITGNSHVVKLPKRVGHSQDYVAASSLAIIKPGWSMVAECLVDGIPFGVIDISSVEDGEIITKLLEKNACFVLNPEELHHLDVKEMNMRAHKQPTIQEENAALDIAHRLLERL